jgi:poly-gamma-glutamate synthesis protein (capsule biosynthesis protein)
MINKILIIISALVVIIVWGFFSFYNSIKIINKPEIAKQVDVVNNIKLEEKIAVGNLLPENPGNEIKKLNMLFFGDMMLDRHVGEKISKYGLDYLFSKLDDNGQGLFNERDLISANLEGAVTNNGQHYKPDNAYDFAFNPKLIDGLKKFNFNFFNIANNHLADQSGNGIIETSKNLNNLGFYFSGCQDGTVDKCSATTTKINNIKIGLAGFSLVYNSKRFDIIKAESIIAGLASTTDLVIVNIHWGTEYDHKFNPTQQKMAYALIDAGADIIIGHHPHVVQGMEIYESKLRTTNADHANEKVRRPIFYSLGNFIFDQYFSADTQEELAVGVEYKKCFSPPQTSPQPSPCKGEGEIGITLLPMRSKGSQPDLMSAADKEKFLTKFISWSEVDENVTEEIRKGEIKSLKIVN